MAPFGNTKFNLMNFFVFETKTYKTQKSNQRLNLLTLHIYKKVWAFRRKNRT